MEALPKPERLTVASYIEAHQPFGAVSQRTARVEQDRARLISKHLGNDELHRVTPARLRDLQNALRREGYAPATINGALRLLHKILTDALDREVIDRLPRWVKPLRETPLRNELSDEEWKRFLDAFDSKREFNRVMRGQERTCWTAFHRSKAVFTVALETGLSRSDLLSLKRSSVNVDAHLIRVRRLKTGIESVIPITSTCETALRAALSWSQSDFVFTAQDRSSAFPVSSLVRYFQLAKRIAGITRRVRFHDLRHSAGCRLARRNVSLLSIGRMLGHASISTTQRYARTTDDAVSKEILAALQ